MKTLAMLVFIAAVGAGAAFLATKQTVIDGKVMAADLLDTMHANGAGQITTVTCDDAIPVATTGAVFTCDVAANDGSTAKIEFTLDRGAKYATKVLTSTGATGTTHESRDRVPASGDPWAN